MEIVFKLISVLKNRKFLVFASILGHLGTDNGASLAPKLQNISDIDAFFVEG